MTWIGEKHSVTKVNYRRGERIFGKLSRNKGKVRKKHVALDNFKFVQFYVKSTKFSEYRSPLVSRVASADRYSGNFVAWNRICTVWKLRNFTLTHFWQKFRESNRFAKEIHKYLVNLTEYFSGESKSFIFPQTQDFPWN